MARLFLKLYLMMAGVLLLTLFADYFEEDYLERILPPRESAAHTVFALVQQSLAAQPQANWPMAVDHLRQAAPTLRPLTTVPALLARGVLIKGDPTRLQEGTMVFWENKDHSIGFAQRIDKGPYVMEMRLGDPVPRILLLWANMAALELLTVGVAMWFWVRPLWQDLRKLDQATAALARADFDTRVALRRGSVVHPLAQSINWMAEHIGNLLASHRALTNAVSHELRTPLARLRFALSLAVDEATPEAKDHQLKRMRRDLDELDALANELLTLAKLERAGQGGLPPDEFPAAEWLADRLEEARATAQALGQQVALDGRSEPVSLHGSPLYLARALDNLLNNAARHARSQVSVRITEQHGLAHIIVDDDGPGIAPEQRGRVFEPFVRLDESRDRASGGVGLGLAIVRQIARNHGGQCEVADSPLGGTRFVLSWPLPHSQTLASVA